MKYAVLAAIFGIGVILGLFFVSTNKTETSKNPEKIPLEATEKVDYQASFAIFTNGTLRDFSSSRYHNLSEDVFIEPSNPMVVNIKKQGITWDDFFKTLPMKLTKTCLTTGTGQVFCTTGDATLKFYINDTKDKDALDKEIQNGDKLLVSFGDENEEEIKMQLKILE